MDTVSNQLPPPGFLLKGDWLGYRHFSLMSLMIHQCTGGCVTHSAVYLGNGLVITSLNDTGVGIYQMDVTGLVMVRRPVGAIDFEAADVNYHANMKGLPYGWLDCLKDKYPDLPDDSNGENCSHSSAEYYRGGGLFLFGEDANLQIITPRDIQLTPALKTVWKAF